MSSEFTSISCHHRAKELKMPSELNTIELNQMNQITPKPGQFVGYSWTRESAKSWFANQHTGPVHVTTEKF